MSGIGKRTELEMLGKKNIILGNNLTKFVVKDLIEFIKPETLVFVIITDTNVEKLYLQEFLNEFKKYGYIGNSTEFIKVPINGNEIRTTRSTKKLKMKKIIHYVIPPGEGNKSRETVSRVQDFLFSEACDRDTTLIGLGGGVIGDLVGFIASTYLRGISFVNIPTTLLAMVDSSIGGKNGVDTPAGKNLIGTIYQPIRIYIDTNFLMTLPKREFCNGMAEIIKTCAISQDQKWFEFLEIENEFTKFITSLDTSININQWDESPHFQLLISKIIQFSVKFKARVVTEDERDKGRRQTLNFGHTIGHALEQHYTPHLLHGECLSIGMILEGKIAVGRNHAEPILIERLETILKNFNLPIGLNDEKIRERILIVPPIKIEKLLKMMKTDKRNGSGSIHIVLLNGIGELLKPRALSVSDGDILTYIKHDIEKAISKTTLTLMETI